MLTVPIWYWIAFAIFVLAALALDLGICHRKSAESGLRSAAVSTLVWCLLAACFGTAVWWLFSRQYGAEVGYHRALEFFTGYLLEWSLSMDNVFVFAVIFNYFRVPKRHQYRVLFWGILGAILLRLLFVMLGTVLIQQFGWVLYVLGGFLIYSAVQLVRHDDQVDPDQGWVLRLARRWLPIAKAGYGDRFFVREAGGLMITTTFLVLLVIETTDVAFAIDSVPAIFGITQDPFIVYTSNIFAILGLRALYFLLAGFMGMFEYLKYGLSAILAFVGLKMLAPLVGLHVQSWVSLAAIVGILATSVVVSLALRATNRTVAAVGSGE
jgi:tellurite resistance protein TerC